MKKRNRMSSGVTSLQYVDDAKKRQARSLRKHATPLEAILWEALRNRNAGGFKFRRQQVIEGFITDFYCEEAQLAIEVDGGIHNDPEQSEIDIHREKVFEARGIHTLHLKNEIVENNLQTALDLIIATARSRILIPQTPLRAERGDPVIRGRGEVTDMPTKQRNEVGHRTGKLVDSGAGEVYYEGDG